MTFVRAPKVTALAAGRLDDGAATDTLLVGSQTNLLAYDVENNSEIYFKVNGDQSDILQGKRQ